MCNTIGCAAMLGGSFVTTTWRVLGLRVDKWPADIESSCEIHWIISHKQTTRGDPPAWSLGVWLTNPHGKKKLATKHLTQPRTWSGSLDKRPKRRNMEMRFGTWNIRNLYRTGWLVTVPKELSKYKLDLVGLQEVRERPNEVNELFQLAKTCWPH
jgi:hypothetical protein